MIAWPIILARMILAIVLGGAVGLEREFHEQRAGIRTNALVALGSALFTLVSAYGFLDLLGLGHVQVDPTRIASYIVAGIGFLGAGAIVVRNSNARGLTTAAAIWMVAAIGMACAVGFYWEAVVATALVLLVLQGLRWLELHLLHEQVHATIQVNMDANNEVSVQLRQIYDLCLKQKALAKNVQLQTRTDEHILSLSCHFARVEEVLALVEELHTMSGVRSTNVEFQNLEYDVRLLSRKGT